MNCGIDNSSILNQRIYILQTGTLVAPVIIFRGAMPRRETGNIALLIDVLKISP